MFVWVPVADGSAVSMPNPWEETDSANAAAEGAGVGTLKLPEAGMEVVGGPIGWEFYRYMDLLAEANGYVGAAELTVMKRDRISPISV